MHEYLDPRLSLIKLRLYRVPAEIRTRPVVAGDRQQVGIAKKGNKRFQLIILGDLADRLRHDKKRRAAIKTALGGHKASLRMKKLALRNSQRHFGVNFGKDR
jgi:hypothetical protein